MNYTQLNLDDIYLTPIKTHKKYKSFEILHNSNPLKFTIPTVLTREGTFDKLDSSKKPIGKGVDFILNKYNEGHMKLIYILNVITEKILKYVGVTDVNIKNIVRINIENNYTYFHASTSRNIPPDTIMENLMIEITTVTISKYHILVKITV